RILSLCRIATVTYGYRRLPSLLSDTKKCAENAAEAIFDTLSFLMLMKSRTADSVNSERQDLRIPPPL
ncbi:hypothetical protein, partial [Porphyromonas gulae]|uniref:hypothetical protein n=1 Tax=Porphyromonas gulae TaxID=111105 RepID=UPI00242ED9A9